jgi:hypothetical protein
LLWTPSIFSGLYLHGEGQAGLLHPFHLFLYGLLPLSIAFNLELLASYVAAFVGMTWFLRRLRLTWAATLFGAMLFAFSGFTLLHHHHLNMVAIVAHLPWLLAASDVLFSDASGRRRTLAWAACVGLLGSELLLGFPQAVWWNLLAFGAYAAFRVVETRRWRPLAACAAAVGVGILVGGIQLVPTADQAAHSQRVGVKQDFVLTISLHPANLIQIVSPYALRDGVYSEADGYWFHEFGIYSGAILPVALAWVWTRRRALPGRRALIVAITGLALVALLLALGRYGGVAWLLAYVPGLQGIRAPARYILFVQFGLAILAAVAFDDLEAIASGRSYAVEHPPLALWIPAALAIASTLALNEGLVIRSRYLATIAHAAPGAAIVLAVTMLVYLAAQRVRWAIAGLVLVTALDLGFWGIRFVRQHRPQTLDQLVGRLPLAPSTPANAYASAYHAGPYGYNVPVLKGYRLTSGYVGLVPATTHHLDGTRALQWAGTRWVITSRGSAKRTDMGVPRARFEDADGNALTDGVELTVDRPGRLVLRARASGPRVLALTERFHDGWSATIDGRRVRTRRVHEDFLGVVVKSGEHLVEFRFMPQSFVYGAASTGIGLVLVAGVLAVGLRPRRRHAPSSARGADAPPPLSPTSHRPFR